MIWVGCREWPQTVLAEAWIIALVPRRFAGSFTGSWDIKLVMIPKAWLGHSQVEGKGALACLGDDLLGLRSAENTQSCPCWTPERQVHPRPPIRG